jgi:hypothetical protein
MATDFQLRQWLRSDGPASKGAQLFMFVSALFCGAALAGLLFVGVWRHTAGEAARNRAAQENDQQALRASRQAVSALGAKLAHEKTLLAQATRRGATANASLAQARTSLRQARAALASAEASSAAARQALAGRLDALGGEASALARTTATLRSELSALETYASQPGPTGIDAGYLAAQVQYLRAAAAAAASAAAQLARAAGNP